MTSLGNRNSQKSFAQVPTVELARSSFDRSHTVKDTFNFDLLVPIYVEEILPADTVTLDLKTFCRLAPQVRPIMDNAYLDFMAFFVPNRLVWDNWQRFMGEQDDPTDSTDFIIPTITAPVGGFLNGSIYDHMGIPTEIAGIKVSALPFRACNLIYNTWIRDENLQDSLTVPKGDGPDAYTLYTLQPRGKRPDYFSSCLPWPQKGDPIPLPIGGLAPIQGIGKNNTTWQAGPVPAYVTGNPNTTQFAPYQIIDNADANQRFFVDGEIQGPNTVPSIYANLNNTLDPITINQFRQAIMLQGLQELDARGGTRYTEIIRAHFKVVSPDQRLQRPEFLGGGTISMSQHPIAQTSETTTESPQGNLAAYSTISNVSGSQIGFSKSFVEHGYIVMFACARADLTYQQGLNKMWTRSTKYDFFWPKLQQLGEQAVLLQELYATGTPAVDERVFGYQERYAEYRYKPSEIRGQFRSNYAQTLDVWHLAEEFSGIAPELNSDFIKSNTPIERSLILPDENYPQILSDMWFKVTHARAMMTYGMPATLGRF